MDPDQFLEMNGGDDEDEALRRAIALSMQGAADSVVTAPGQAVDGQGYIDLTSSPPAEPVRVQKKEEAPAPTAASSMMGLDRKRMEEERLARLQKRKAADSSVADAAPPPPAKRPAPSGDRGHDKVYRPALSETESKAQAASTSREPPKTHRLDDQRERPETQKGISSIATTTAKSGDEALPFPQGVVKKTWAYGSPRNGDDIKIEEVLQAKDLELAVLSSFQWDEEWLMSKLDMRKTKLVLVAYAGDDNQKAEMRANVPSSIRFCFPPMHGGTCMHSKLQLLKYPTYLRVVVPTGNLVPYDWGETGVMENMVFMVDLPRIKVDADKRNSNHLTPFGEELTYFLNAQRLDESLVQSLRNYDFSETRRYGLVHTIAGSHYDGAWQRTGYCGLGRSVKALGLETSDPVSIDFICSSVGSLKMDLLTALYNACQGDSGMAEYQSRTNKSKKGKSTTSSDDRSSLVKSRMRIYFPSLSTVENSRGGKGVGRLQCLFLRLRRRAMGLKQSRQAAGTICFQSKWWNAPTFPREVLRDLENVRNGVLMHSKIMFVRPESKPEASWVYLGSANMSESAWGRLVKEQGTGRPKLNCRNWECGVLLPTMVSDSASLVKASAPDEGASMLDIFREVVPIPVKLPGTAYQEGDSRRPWFSHDW